jgi:arylsulfatase
MPLGFARIINLLEDPKEREPVNQKHVRWWVMQHARRIIRQFEDTVEEEQLIPCGAPVDFVPAQPSARYVVVPSGASS